MEGQDMDPESERLTREEGTIKDEVGGSHVRLRVGLVLSVVEVSVGVENLGHVVPEREERGERGEQRDGGEN